MVVGVKPYPTLKKLPFPGGGFPPPQKPMDSNGETLLDVIRKRPNANDLIWIGFQNHIYDLNINRNCYFIYTKEKCIL